MLQGRQARVVGVSSSFPLYFEADRPNLPAARTGFTGSLGKFSPPDGTSIKLSYLNFPRKRGMKMKAKGGGGRFPVSGPGGGGGGGGGGRRRYRRWYGEGGGGGARDQEKSSSSASTPIPTPLSPLEPSFNSIVCSRVLFCIQCLGKVNCGGFPVLLGFDPNLKHPVAISIRLLVLNISSYLPRARAHTHCSLRPHPIFRDNCDFPLFDLRPSVRAQFPGKSNCINFLPCLGEQKKGKENQGNAQIIAPCLPIVAIKIEANHFSPTLLKYFASCGERVKTNYLPETSGNDRRTLFTTLEREMD